MQEFKNAIGYIRVSTDEQASDDKYGIEVQKREILLYANNNGYNIVDWRIDKISGAKDNRPEMDKILYGEDVTNPPYQAVIVFKNDRVARDTKLYFYYFTRWKSAISSCCPPRNISLRAMILRISIVLC